METGREITYLRLTEQNFNEHSLEGFDRRQPVKRCYRNTAGGSVLMDCDYVDDWDEEKRRWMTRLLLDGISGCCTAYGAFLDGRVVGYILLSHRLFGSEKQYAEVLLYHISAPVRRMGIGRRLFGMACERARELGAKKLYISANPAYESQEAYRRLGCVIASERDDSPVPGREDTDIVLEYVL